jgi:DNA-directed RNA polymerase subunit L/DNA-directed RNA polymerase alpha subunit
MSSVQPVVSSPYEENGVYTFTLSQLNVSIANSIRRVILQNIPTVVFYTETHEKNQCRIEVNTSRLHNEIVKQRLSCIPIHTKDLNMLPENYLLEVDVKNETDNIMYATTEDFRIKHKATGEYISVEETQKIFPRNPKTQMFIDFLRLRPKISDTIPGEHIKLTCEFSVSSADVSSMFNVVSKCSYANTPDPVAADRAWSKMEEQLVAENNTQDEIQFQKKNFYLLDAQRYFKPDSFDFVIQSIGIYENHELVKKACAILQGKFVDMLELIQSDGLTVLLNGESTMPNCYDIVLENEDYTMGKVIEYFLYTKYYEGDKILSFCGFKKFHPHNTDSIIRVAYRQPMDKTSVKQHLYDACKEAQEVYTVIYKQF